MKKLICVLLLTLPLTLSAAQDFYQFDSSAERTRFVALTSELRCLVCQNQNLAESNAPLAVDLRDQIYQHIQKGQSDQAIVNYLVARYGNFILYRPPLNATTFVLWSGPFLFLLIGIIFLLNYIRKKNIAS